MQAENHTNKVIDAPDDEVERWLEGAQSGDVKSLEKLRCWAYFNARSYFGSRVPAERSLQEGDIGDLTSKFFIDFEKIWPKARCITRYSRSLMKCTVTRYLGSRRRRREVPLEIPGLGNGELPVEESAIQVATDAYNNWSDVEWEQYEAVLQAFSNADSFTRRIVTARMSSPPIPYSVLADELRSTTTSLRMRMSRFYRLVRSIYSESTAGRRRPAAIKPFTSDNILRRPWLD